MGNTKRRETDLVAENAQLRQRIAVLEQQLDAYQQLDEAYRVVVEYSPQGLFIIQDRRVVFANATIARVSGYTVDEMLAFAHDEIWGIFHPDDRPSIQQRCREHVGDTNVVADHEYRLIRKDGAVCWVELCATTTKYRGTPAIQATCIDITERKQAEADLHVNQVLLQAIIDHAPAGIFVKDLQGRILLANRSVSLAFRGTATAMVGHLHDDIFPPEVVEQWHNQEQHVLRTGQSITFEEPGLVDHEQHTYLTTKFPIRNGQDVIYAVGGITTDITERKRTEADLRTSEEQFRAFFEQAPVAIGVSRNGKTIMVNPAYLRIFGYDDPADIVGQDLVLSIAPDERAGVLDRAQRRHAGEVVATYFEMTGMRKDGTCFPVICEVAQITLMDGQPASVAFFTDVSKLKQVERELREREALFRRVWENTSEAIALSDHTGIVVTANPAYARLYGHPLEMVIGHPFEMIFHSEAQAWAQETYQDLFTAQRPVPIHETTVQRADGTKLIVEVSADFIKREDGHVLMLSAIRDLTQQKQAEAALRESEAVHRALIEAMPDVILRLRHTGTQIDIKLPTDFVPPHPSATNPGVNVADVLPPDLGRRALADIQRTLTTQAMQTMEYHLEIEGKYYVREVRMVPLDNNEVMCIVRDITESYRSQEALQESYNTLEQRVAERTTELRERTTQLVHTNARLNKALRSRDEFLASMSHELRTPLNAVLGLSETLLEEAHGQINAKQRTSLRTIAESGNHLLALINDVLDLARIEAGKIELELGRVNVPAVCHNSLRLVWQMAEQKHLHLSHDLDPQVSLIQADERRLKQILVNLLSNAIKFTPPGGQIGLEVQGNHDRQSVLFRVWDTGIGIAPEHMSRLFRPFVQIDSGLDRHYGGTGLGLALVARLAELHGGGVTVESTVGQGSRFSVVLPQATIEHRSEDEEPDEAAPPDAPAPVAASISMEATADAPAPLVLLAEDNPTNSTMLAEYLLLRDYRVEVVNTGVAAVDVAQRKRPDLVLMDIQMPEMDGLEAIRHIRKMPELAQVPIIALTALAMPGDKERCLEAGATVYLSKPFNLSDLVQIMQQQFTP